MKIADDWRYGRAGQNPNGEPRRRSGCPPRARMTRILSINWAVFRFSTDS